MADTSSGPVLFGTKGLLAGWLIHLVGLPDLKIRQQS
jgi:hypothetical protein